MIKIRNLIAKLGIVRKHDEAVSKALRNEELLFVFSRKSLSVPFSVGIGALSEILANVKNL